MTSGARERSERRTALAAGARLGPYEVVSLLGAGGMGEVYRARDTRLGRDVAIKVLPASFSADPDRLRRFEQEARAAGILNHPNITVLHDIGSHDGAPYVVSELLEGETLRSRLSAGPLPSRRAVDYAIQIAHGLAAAHDKGIVHRDVKPENLFVTRDGRVKLLDFGLAKLTHPETRGLPLTELPTATAGTDAAVVVGTVGYMSPEQLRGQPLDPRSDIFAFGAVLYEILTGRRAFSGGSAADVMTAILTREPPDLPAEIPGTTALERIVRHCLEKNPAERFQSARDLAFDLESLSGDSGASAVIAAAPSTPERKRGRVAASIAVLAALACAAGGLVVGRRLGETPPPAYRQISFKRGSITTARFAPDGQTILYSAAWGGDPVQVFLKRPESPDAVTLDPPGAALLGVSRSGEAAIALGCRFAGRTALCTGTLARAPLAGGSPRAMLESVQQADWAPDGSALAVVRDIEGRSRLEFPPGRVLYETNGHVSDPRFSPDGDLIAFFDHPSPGDMKGSVAVIDLSGKKRTLAPTSVRGVWGLAWSPSGKEIWFSEGKAGPVAVYGVTLSGKERLVARAPGHLRIHDVSRDGRALVSRSLFEQSCFALAPGESRERDLTWLGWSPPRFLSEDGKTLLFEEQALPAGANYATCLRRTDGSPVVRLGEGVAIALSPDGRWALSRLPPGDRGYTLLPTGAGEARPISYDGIDDYRRAVFLPDGSGILFEGRRRGEPVRFFRGSLEGGTPRPLTPPATGPFALSPDGRRIAAYSDGVPALFSLDDGPEGRPRPIPGATSVDVPRQWTRDGRSVYVARPTDLGAQVDRVEVDSGRRTPWKTIVPGDRAGASVLAANVQITPDGTAYAYSVLREVSQLYLVEGLK